MTELVKNTAKIIGAIGFSFFIAGKKVFCFLSLLFFASVMPLIAQEKASSNKNSEAKLLFRCRRTYRRRESLSICKRRCI